MRVLLLFFWVLVVMKFSLCGQEIPEERLVNWTAAGLYHEFKIPVNQVNVLDFGATGDGITNDALAFQSAINSFSGLAGIVMVPAGTYLLQSPISIPDSIILKGVGSDSTILKFDLEGVASNCINLSKAQNQPFQNIDSGYLNGSKKILVGNASTFSVGDYAEIRQKNGSWDTNPVSWADYSVGQIVKIVHVSGDTLFLKHPLRIDYDVSLNPEIRKIEPRENAGVECLKVIRVDEPASGAGSNINLSYAANCRIAGVESDHSVGAHINLHYCSNIEISGCYVHDAFTYDGSGTRGYGVCMSMHSGECLVENNIFKHLRHAMMVKTGSNGNVFAYNYSIEPHRSEPISDFSGDISLHGHFAYANLFEGNICQNIIIDHYWGPSGPYNTFLRNRAEWYGLIMTDDNGYSTNQQNIVGNEITEKGYNFFIQLWYGLYYVLTGNNHFEWGNNSDGEIIPAGTAETAVSSLYLDYTPEFWRDELPWPSIGYPHDLDSGSIPAKERYYSGDIKTVCPTPKMKQLLSMRKGWQGVSTFLRPFPDELAWMFDSVSENIEVIINADGSFYPDQEAGDLTNWNSNTGYITKTSDSCQLSLEGAACDYNELDVEDGWNLIPVYCQGNITVDSLIQRLPGQVMLIKEIAGGNAWWPAENISSLTTIEPGKAYWIKILNE